MGAALGAVVRRHFRFDRDPGRCEASLQRENETLLTAGGARETTGKGWSPLTVPSISRFGPAKSNSSGIPQKGGVVLLGPIQYRADRAKPDCVPDKICRKSSQ